MGCTSSKLDDLPAVALCRERCTFLDEAIHQRYALAEAHFAYLHSLKGVGLSLHRFFDQDLHNSAEEPPSPILNLPAQRKGDPEPSGSPPHKVAHHSHSNSGSHLHFHDSDSDLSVLESPLHHHSGNSSPLRPYGQINYADHEALSSYPVGAYTNMNMNYMKNKATPSVSYEQRPMSPETGHMGESSSSYYPYPYDNQNPSSYPYYGYPNYGGGGMNGFVGTPAAYGSYPPVVGGTSSEASTSKQQAPPPPSPPRTSAWDFLYPFESGENYYPAYTPSRDSKELREEEGIPDLEDEDFQHEVAKDVYADQKFGDGGGKSHSKEVVEDEDGKAGGSDSLYQTRPSVSMENDPVEYEVHMVDKKVVDNEERTGDRGNVSGFKARGDLEVVKEIQVQFERASESGSELAKMLEVGKFPYKKNAAVSSKMLHVITPSLPVASSQPYTSKNAEPSSIERADPALLDIDKDVGMRSGNLSSTLQKLYLWEKKLYEEVKVEEKMRLLHERKCRRLKRLDERGAEAHKVDATRTLVRSLSTKIRIAIQVVDKISVKINKLRDEDLWPQLNEFIQGLRRMWKSMLECHRNQCQAIGQARRLDAFATRKHFSDAHLEATLQLEHELLEWTLRFSCWVGAQKGYVRALNSWLLKCLLYVPEETPDGIVPFSPSRIGAPPVFVICNQWSQALDIISEKEVVDSMRDFATSVLQLWERDKLEMRQRMMTNKGMEKKVKNLEREDQKIQKEIHALDKRIILVSGDGNGLLVSGHVYQSDTSKTSSLQLSLQHIFEAMERFTANSLSAYELLLQRVEEDRRDRLARENENEKVL
ncbi:protein ALTERED PHOSPHATE STARVATION RESPONSE 1-like isoform X1 [Actinidia eriantha]|uniref:protein ALTERED PHOSPHATE STARVATION RESPONSE 1-like isoform X1 n=1 Tax=Actinidia eriantha TaxID=165200 RepID=UPI002590E0FE|nr:protein ALTERED PHOSPHATE STARVATION RESPONSE 1-like isoform X1 [Actinidia eriantha]